MDEKMGKAAGNGTGGRRLVYDHEAGMNWDQITDDIIVGSCLQVPEDVDRSATGARVAHMPTVPGVAARLVPTASVACRLQAEGVTLVICLQQDTDMVREKPSPLQLRAHSGVPRMHVASAITVQSAPACRSISIWTSSQFSSGRKRLG
jgi:hypothetical protein